MRILALILLSGLSFFSYAATKVEGAWVRLLPPGVTNTAGYLTIHNDSDTDKVLVAASALVVDRVELHEHVLEQGMMKMTQRQRVDIPAGQRVSFQPGGLHLMMFGLKAPLKAKQLVQIQLEFADGERIEVDAQVAEAPPASEHHHH
ncbi:copper chaperone PCu(A)C [Aliiglaciecola sp. CAU 1673]|uniref:copper chaperone PCu(A)C n=1 Tax=Aliiglaciecola sp. CAU 1673 TaxID=3032595 RepID=UPI0023DCACEF|nr:copper chaperone PCu(A)C [Aliiglaciecola sp. CAU 1673]MDF2180325.1 copper chaperone PCu(A)C [Aliiglaciecola sp. CAU 1673]